MNFVFETLTACVNKALKSVILPESLDCTNVSPIYKKDDPSDKKNNRPVSILTFVSRCMEQLCM